MPTEHAQKSHDFPLNSSGRFRKIWFRKIQTNLVQKDSDYYEFRMVQTIIWGSDTSDNFRISESFWISVWIVQPVPSNVSESVQKNSEKGFCVQRDSDTNLVLRSDSVLIQTKSAKFRRYSENEVHEGSGHMTSKWRHTDIHATSLRCIDICTTSFSKSRACWEITPEHRNWK